MVVPAGESSKPLQTSNKSSKGLSNNELSGPGSYAVQGSETITCNHGDAGRHHFCDGQSHERLYDEFSVYLDLSANILKPIGVGTQTAFYRTYDKQTVTS